MFGKALTGLFLSAAVSVLSGADLNSKALLPVKWEKAPAHAALKLVENGELRFAVVYDPATETRYYPKLSYARRSGLVAAGIIADAFERTTGKKPEILPPGSPKLAEYPYVIAVGKTPYAEALKLDGTKMPAEGYTLATFGKGIVICGYDGSLLPDFYNNLDWYRYRFNGTANGAVDFCERFLGMRYYYPGIGVYAPKTASLTVEPARYSDAPYYKDRFNWAVERQFRYGIPWKGVKNNNRDQEHYWRMAIATRYQSGHSPDPQAMGELFPDKLDTIFFTDKFGHRYYVPSTHIGNYFDVTNPEFVNILVDCFVKFYETNGKYRAPWKRSHAPNSEYVLFGQCDTMVRNIENERSKPHLHPKAPESGKFTDVYMHFWIMLGKEVEKRLPGKKIGFSLYHNYALPPQEKYTDVPKNLMPKLDIGTPAWTRSPKARKLYTERYRAWSELFGHPINAYWYGVQTNAYSKAVQGSYMGELLTLLKPYISRDGLMLDAGGLDYHFYYSYYPVYRAMWNPSIDAHACVDEHWELLYGEKAGKTLRKFYQLVKDRWEKNLVPSLNEFPATSVPPEKLYAAYSVPVVNQLEALLKQAEKETQPGSIERQRLEFFMAPWKQELTASRTYLTHVTPVHKVTRLEDGCKPVIDGKMDESFWKDIPKVKLQHALGSETPDRYPKTAKIAWNDQGIYIGFYEEGKPASKAGDLWFKSDHLEFFLSPGRGKEEYLHFAVDPTGDTAQGRRRLKPIDAAYDGKWKCAGFEAKACLGGDFWSCEMFIPFAGLGVKAPRPYSSWFFNLLAMDRRDMNAYGFSLTMNNNHNYNLFGLMKFMGEGD